MAFKYPLTMKAAQGLERDQWTLGDALLKECGPPSENGVNNGSFAKLLEAQQELAANGIDYAENTLRIYRDVSYWFSAATRIAAVSHRVHIECGSPQVLNAVLKAWEEHKAREHLKPNAPLALHMCARLLAEYKRELWAKAGGYEYDTRRAAAKKTLEAAKGSVKQARETAKAAIGPAARRMAQTSLQQAETARQRAIDELAALPKPSTLSPEESPAGLTPNFIFMTEMKHRARKATELAKETLTECDKLDLYEIRDTSLAMLQEEVMTAINTWREVMQKIAKESGRERAHLMVAT